jgi:anti-anti-sigma factor
MPLTAAHLHILEHTENGWTRVCLTGELDLTSGPQLRNRLSELGADRSAVRLDLSRLEFIDSTGLQVLVQAIKESERDGWRLHIDRLSTPQVTRLLKLVDLDELILGYDSERRADVSRRLRVRLSPLTADHEQETALESQAGPRPAP